jgi:hypothetical protein
MKGKYDIRCKKKETSTYKQHIACGEERLSVARVVAR